MNLGLDRSTWKRYRFDQIASSVTDRVDDPSAAGVTRYVGLEHLDPGSMTVDRWGSPDEVSAQKLRFQPGDVIFGRRRAYQRKVARADFTGICSAHALVLRAKHDVVHPDFLPVFLSSGYFLDRAIRISVGSLSPTVNWRDLARQEFDLPTLDQQQRIADLLWHVEAEKRASANVAERAMIARESALGEQLRAISVHGDSIALDSLIVEGRPICYGILMPGLHVEGGVPVIKVKDFPDGCIRTQDLLLTHPDIAAAYRRSTLRTGDLLISIRGTVGRVAEVPEALDGANITQDTARLSIAAERNTDYVRLALESKYVQAQIKRMTTGLAVKGLNIGALRKVQIPMPASGEQVAALLQRARKFEMSVAASQERAQAAGLLAAALVRENLGPA